MAKLQNKWLAVIDGKEEKQYDAVPIFSPDGNMIAYKVKSGNKWSVIVDGIEGKHYDYTDTSNF